MSISTIRLAEIKRAWIGTDRKGLAVVGNTSYRMVAELIEEVESLQDTIRQNPVTKNERKAEVFELCTE